MASIQKTKLRTPDSTKRITYITNDAEIITSYSGWTQDTETIYRFYYSGIVLPSNNFSLSVYVNDSYVGTITATYVSGDSFNWNGTATYHGITLSISCGANSSQYLDEKFTLYKEDTLEDNEALFGASDKTYKIYFKDNSGTYLVYHEQIVAPTYQTSDVAHDEITWNFKNNDPDIPVNMYARIGTASFTLKASNVAVGANGALVFTGLSASTSYNVDVYCVPVTSALKINSAEATDTKTTNAPPVKTWVYKGTTGTYNYATTVGPYAICKLFSISAGAAQLETNRPAASQVLGYKGRVSAYDTATPLPNHCGYKYYEVEYA